MAAKTTNTIWPDNVPVAVKDTIEEFFQLLDGYTPQAARQWSELYLPTGEFEAFCKIFKGHEMIRNHILRFWSSFPGLNHVPKKVYLHRPDGLDITVITEYEITFPNGLHVKGESVAVLEFVERDERLFLSSNRLILDPNPLMAGLEAQAPSQIPSQPLPPRNKPTSVHTENIAEEVKF